MNSDSSYIDDKFTIDELLKRSWQFRNSDEFVKFFDFIARFDHYSRYNTMLVYIQNPEVTFFGGVSYWKKKFNRTVKPEAKPYIILTPMGPVMLVYDVMETQGKLSPEEFLEKGLGRKPFSVSGELLPGTLEHALAETGKWGIKTFYKDLSYFHGGYITTIFKGKLEICIKQGVKNEENFATLIHELAHLFLGHTGHVKLSYEGKEKPALLLQRKLSRSAEELEAEAVSYLICHKLGLITDSASYIAGYIKSEDDLLQFSYETVIKTADKIEKLFINSTSR